MTTNRQILSNRQNSRKSTGPRSEDGRARSRMNALRHGILSKQLLIPGEIEAELHDLWLRLYDDFQPQGTLEDEVLDQIVSGFWRLRRLRMVEAGLFSSWLEEDGINGESKNNYEIDTSRYLQALGLSFIRDGHSSNAFSKLSRYETSMLRALHRDLLELQRLQAARQGEVVQSAVALDVTIDGARERVLGASE